MLEGFPIAGVYKKWGRHFAVCQRVSWGKWCGLFSALRCGMGSARGATLRGEALLGRYAAVVAEFRRSEEIDLMAEVEFACPRAAGHFDGKLVGAGAIVFGRLSAGVGAIGGVDARGADWAFVWSVTEFHFGAIGEELRVI